MKIRKIFFNNAGLKSLALLLAFVTWFYIGEATKVDSAGTVLQKIFSPTQFITKKLYIKPVFVGSIPSGYEFKKEAVTITPEFYVVVGPSNFLKRTEFIFTKPIDLSEHTRAKTLEVDLESPSRSVKFQKVKAEVYLPVLKVGSGVEK